MLKAKQEKEKAAYAIEVCVPAVDLRQVPRRRNQMHKLACAQVYESSTTTHTAGEENSPVAAASLEGNSNGAALQNSIHKYFEPVKETRMNAQVLQSLILPDAKDLFLRSSMKDKKPKQLAFD